MSRAKKSYGQFCPVAKAAEVVAERWTPLVLRELMCGSHRFGDLAKGVPLMSPSLLSQRLSELADAGIVDRSPAARGRGYEYRLTAAGEALRPVIESLGLWGYQFLKGDLKKSELDPAYLMWDVRRSIHTDKLPAQVRTTVQFELSGVPAKKRRWWLVVDGDDVDLCLKPPGYEVDLEVKAPIRTLVDIWLGNEDLRGALRGKTVQLAGSRRLARAFPTWFGPSRFVELTRARTS